MSDLIGKTIVASPPCSSGRSVQVGAELKKLRQIAGKTQKQVADYMGIQQAAVSKIEKGGEVYITTVERYVHALGATLRVDASFPADAPISAKLHEVFDLEPAHEDQLLLPLMGDDPFKPQRDVVLSIKPFYSNKILAGEKRVELRRRFPVAAPNGTMMFIYSTSPVKAMVGSASIRAVQRLPVDQIWSRYSSVAHIERDEFDKYFDGLEDGYALELGAVRTFEKPVPLSELRERFGFEPPQSFLYAKRELRRALQDESTVVSN